MQDTERIVCVSATIGSVVGKLLEKKSISDGTVVFDFTQQLSQEDEFKGIFYREGNEYFLFNKATNEDRTIALSFPGNMDSRSESYIIPGYWAYNLSSVFWDSAKNNNSRFILSAGVNVYSHEKRIRVGENLFVTACKYLDIKFNSNNAVLKANNVNLSYISEFMVKGPGDSKFTVRNIKAEQGGDTRIIFPMPFAGGELVDIKITCMLNDPEIPVHGSSKYLFRLTEEKYKEIESASQVYVIS